MAAASSAREGLAARVLVVVEEDLALALVYVHSIVRSCGCARRGSPEGLRGGAHVVVVGVAQDRHVDVQAGLARRLHERRQRSAVEQVLEPVRDFARLHPAARLYSGSSPSSRGRRRCTGRGRRPRSRGSSARDASIVSSAPVYSRHVLGRRAPGSTRETRRAARGRRAEPARPASPGCCRGCTAWSGVGRTTRCTRVDVFGSRLVVLLVEERRLDAVRVARERQRTVAQVGQQPRRDLREVDEQVALRQRRGVSVGRPELLVEVGHATPCRRSTSRVKLFRGSRAARDAARARAVMVVPGAVRVRRVARRRLRPGARLGDARGARLPRRRLVVAQAEEHGRAQVVVARPLRELDLDDELGPHPASAAFFVGRRSAWAGVSSNGDLSVSSSSSRLRSVDERLVVEAGADVARVDAACPPRRSSRRQRTEGVARGRPSPPLKPPTTNSSVERVLTFSQPCSARRTRTCCPGASPRRLRGRGRPRPRAQLAFPSKCSSRTHVVGR